MSIAKQHKQKEINRGDGKLKISITFRKTKETGKITNLVSGRMIVNESTMDCSVNHNKAPIKSARTWHSVTRKNASGSGSNMQPTNALFSFSVHQRRYRGRSQMDNSVNMSVSRVCQS